MTQAALKELLTKRQREVLYWVMEGLTNKQIAAALFIADHTVEKHLDHIFQRLGVSGRVQAAVLAARAGLEI
jgi:DNA-binding CsgD family transcriptional regulator